MEPLQMILLLRLENGSHLMVSQVPGRSMVILTDGLVKMVNSQVDLPSTQTRFLEPGGVMDTRAMSTNGTKPKTATSEHPLGRKRLRPMKPQLMRPLLMTIQQSRLTHRKENPAIPAYHVLKA